MGKEHIHFLMVGCILESGYKVRNMAEVFLLGLTAESIVASGLKILSMGKEH